MAICFYLPEAVHASRVEQTRMGMEAANPQGWSVSDFITVGGLLSGLSIWLWKKPLKKFWNMWKAPDRIELILQKLDHIVASVNLATALSQVTWTAIPRPIWQSDANGMTVFVNPHMLKILCRQDDEILGNGWINIVHEDDRERVSREWENALKNKRDFHLHYRWTNAAGETIPVVVHASRLMSTNGELLGFIGFATLLDA